MVCEALLVLGLAQLIVATVPFRVFLVWSSRSFTAGASDEALLLDIRRAIAMAARNMPWQVVCLPQAIAAKIMLARRGQRSFLHLGARYNKEGRLVAHAWLVASDIVVVGAKGIAGVTPLAKFA
jgi:hypothetical protein